MKHFNSYHEIISASMNEILSLTGSEIGMLFFDEKDLKGHDKICKRNGECFLLDCDEFENLRHSAEKIFGDPTFGISINNRAKTELEIRDNKIKIDRAMIVSLISGDEIFGSAIVCNKKHEYDSTDTRQFHLFVSGMLDIIVKKRMLDGILKYLIYKKRQRHSLIYRCNYRIGVNIKLYHRRISNSRS